MKFYFLEKFFFPFSVNFLEFFFSIFGEFFLEFFFNNVAFDNVVIRNLIYYR